MKSASDNTGKERMSVEERASKLTCGTLSYLAECRGISRKSGIIRRPAPAADIMNGITGKHPTGR